MTDPSTPAGRRDAFIRAAEERIQAAREFGDALMATAIRVELLTMWAEGRREAVCEIRERIFAIVDDTNDGEAYIQVDPLLAILDAVAGEPVKP